ncbi:hypothetical protein GMJAKD_15505 [Candidatus Electrothrix aarhusensis]
MKILHAIDSEGFYGAETMLVNLVAEQQRQGDRATIINMQPCPVGKPSIKTAAFKQGLEFDIIPLKVGMDFRGAWKIVRYALDNQFDIIHCHGYKANILIGLMPKLLRKLPIVTTLHGWCSTKKFTKLWLFEQLDLFALKFIDAVVVVNKAMLGHSYLQNSRLNIHVVNNGLPPINFSPFASLDQDIVNFCQRDGLLLGAIGRLSKEKGFDLLLEMLAGLVQQGINPSLVILGEGRERSALERLIAEHGLEKRVLITGYREGARNYIPLFDLFVMPSFTEGLPITLLEAMQADVPIVASAVGGIPEVLDDGKAGLLVKPGDREGLQRTIVKIAKDKQLADKLRKNAINRVNTEYSCSSMTYKYKHIYTGILRA